MESDRGWRWSQEVWKGGAENRGGGDGETRRDGVVRDDADHRTETENHEKGSRGRWGASGGANGPTPAAKGLSGAEGDAVRRSLYRERVRAN
ncbi:hypothetical protein F2Q70_00020101 [Brassica cretica]|uniref:Uncharacterized protein n=1 Tax=Brassica cretica TaxID=69181 RepID=A0A8S9GPC1_BRACR|nr:hypothetical protein F2Q70_00020101 [Brassica cretica]